MAEGFAKECAVVTHYRLKADKGKPLHVDPEAEARRAAHHPAHVRDDHLEDVQELGAELSRPAAPHQPVVQRRPLGDADAAVPAHGGVPLAGGTHRARDAEGGRGGSAQDPDGRVPQVRRGVHGDAGADRAEDRGAEVPRRGLHALHRGDDAGRQGAPGRHVALPRAELRQGVRRDVQERARTRRSSPGRRAGASRTRLIGGLDHDALGRQRPGRARRGSRPLHVVICPLGQERRGARAQHRRGREAGDGASRRCRATSSSATSRSR